VLQRTYESVTATDINGQHYYEKLAVIFTWRGGGSLRSDLWSKSLGRKSMQLRKLLNNILLALTEQVDSSLFIWGWYFCLYSLQTIMWWVDLLMRSWKGEWSDSRNVARIVPGRVWINCRNTYNVLAMVTRIHAENWSQDFPNTNRKC
jgi:hypothetical protein